MSSELLGKLLNTLSNISESIRPIPFWKDYSFWLPAISAIALFVTLYFLIKYTRATEKMASVTEVMAKYQLIPAIDVNMVYDKSVGRTYFWFSNASNLPGMIHLESSKNKKAEEEVYKPLRIPPKRNIRTAITFDFSPLEKDEFILYASVKPAIDKTNLEITFEKAYTFTENQWKEKSWGIPDPPFSFSANQIS